MDLDDGTITLQAGYGYAFHQVSGCNVGCHELHQARMAGDRGGCAGRGRCLSQFRPPRSPTRTPARRPRSHRRPGATSCCTTSSTGPAPTARPAEQWWRTRSTTRTSTATSRRCSRAAHSRSTRCWPTRSWRAWRSSIEWPYGSNLHCEILVDDQIVAQADQFIAPRLFRVKDDPLYGALQCGAPLDIPVAGDRTPPPDRGTARRCRRRRAVPA